MGDTNQKELIILIKSVLDEQGYTKLHEENKKLGEDQKKGKEGADDFGDAMSGLQTKAVNLALAYVSFEAVLAGVTKAWDFLKDSFGAAVEGEQAAYKLEAAFQVYNKTGAATVGQTKEFISALASYAGIVDERLIPAFDKLLAVTGDSDQAQKLLKIATDAAMSGFGEMEGNVNILTKAIRDGGVKGTDEFSTSIKKMTSAGKDLTWTLNQYGQAVEKTAAQNDTAKLKIDQAKVSWDETKEVIGSLALGLVDYLKPALEGVSMAIGTVYLGTQLLIAAFVSLEVTTFAAGKAALQVATGDFTGAYQTMAKAADIVKTRMSDAFTDGKQVLDDIYEQWNKTADKIVTGPLAKIKAGGDGPKGEKGAAKKYGPFTEDFEAYQKYLKDKQDLSDKELAQVRAAQDAKFEASKTALIKMNLGEKDHLAKYVAMLKDRLKNDNLSAKDRERIERELAETENKIYKIDADNYKKAQDEKKKVLDGWTRHIGQSAKDQLKANIKAIEDDLKKYKWSIEEKKKMEKALAALKKKLNQMSLSEAGDIAMQVGELGKTMFGESKEAAVASAIINTLVGATKAFAEGGIAGFVTGALVLAAGMAQVQEIQSTEPAGAGTGFDDPDNDMMMRLTFKRWAQDASREMLGGLQDGFSGAGKQTVNDYSTHIGAVGETKHETNYNVHADMIIDTDRQLRQLQQKMAEAEALNREGLVR